MKKKLFSVAITYLLCLALAMVTFAEYVPCLESGEEHEMSEWTLVETHSDGSTLLNRTCSKCGYVQKGFGTAGADGVAITKSGTVAITTLLGVGESAPDAATGNPSTGAIA